MKKFWQLFFSTILIGAGSVVTAEVTSELTIIVMQNLPFHPDINFNANIAERNYQSGNLSGQGKDAYSPPIQINWEKYARTWTEFKQFYKTISLKATGYAAGKEAEKKSFASVSITTASIDEQTTWHGNDVLRKSGSKYCLVHTSKGFPHGSYNEEGVYYDAYVSGTIINIRFHLWTIAYQTGIGSIWTESQVSCSGGTVNSSWSLTGIKNSLNAALAKQIDFASNYSGSLEDDRNVHDPTGKGNDLTTVLNGVVAKTLGDEYVLWKPYIEPFIFSNQTRKATISFRFTDHNKTPQSWVFSTPINITLSSDYWGKSLKERLHIKPGRIVNPEDATKGTIIDEGLQLEPENVTETNGGNMQYHTTATIEFDGMENSSEWLTVNGQPVEVLDNKFYYKMVDERVDKKTDGVNVYEIVAHHDDGSYQKEYKIKYTINNLVPTLAAKWYAWDPEKNANQKKLITPTLPNGDPNPSYDPEINPKTGTKTQIIWVNKKSEYPFPLDPVDKNNRLIDANSNRGDYDLGFIAEGSVAGKGIQQLFNAEEVKTVSREEVDNSLNQLVNPTAIQKLTEINPDTANKYWSWQGMWHYITRTTDGLAYEKYALIGSDSAVDKYPRFLDVLDDDNIAVDFWTTIHGVHLKYFLVTYKDLDSKDLMTLNYEQVVSYWKEYVSMIANLQLPPDPNPITYFDLGDLTIVSLKMNMTTIELIKQELVRQIKEKTKGTKLVYNEDYHFDQFDDSVLSKLLEYDNNGIAKINLSISALPTSTRAIGTKSFVVVNNLNFDPDHVVDLDQIKFAPYTANFSEFTVEQLRKWILTGVANKVADQAISISYPDDYGVQPLDDAILQEFIVSQEPFTLALTIYAAEDSAKTVGATTWALTNDLNAEPAPPDPPGPDPDPKPEPPKENSWNTRKTNLIIISVIVLLAFGTTSGLLFIKYRMKKGIGGKKLKTAQKNESKKQSD